MDRLGTIELKGKSGKSYEFNIWLLDTPFKDIGAVYVFTRAVRKTGGSGHTHDILYVGQTGGLATRLPNHHKLPCLTEAGANRICVLATPKQEDRLAIEEDLCGNYKPICNDLLKSVPDRFWGN